MRDFSPVKVCFVLTYFIIADKTQNVNRLLLFRHELNLLNRIKKKL